MLEKYAATLEKRGVDPCSSQILAEVLESFPSSLTIKQLARKTGKSERYIKRKVKDMKKDEIPIQIRRGSRTNYITTSLFEPVSWILKEKENAEKRTQPAGGGPWAPHYSMLRLATSVTFDLPQPSLARA